MKRFVTSLILLLSLTLTSVLRANASSQWMWHGEFPWVYSYAENSWWYMPLSEYGASKPASGWMWHGAFPWVYSHSKSTWQYMRSPSSDGKFSAWKQSDKKWHSFNEASQSWVVLPGQEDVQEDQQVPTANRAGDTYTIPDLSLEMLWVEPGTFTMGSPESEPGRSLGYQMETQHEVTLTNGFWLGKYEVTQAQWQEVMGNNPSRFKGADRPVEGVTWNNVKVFCSKLNEREAPAGRLPAGMVYQLPTEAQWEYACRAGTTTAYSWGNDVNATLLNYKGNIGETTDVGQYAANPWGFFDMHGNIFEWCADRYPGAAYSTGDATDPTGPTRGSYRALRGGSLHLAARYARSALRYYYLTGLTNGAMGFRLSLRLAGKHFRW